MLWRLTTCARCTCSARLLAARRGLKAISTCDWKCGPEIDYADLLDIQESLEERLGRSVEIVTNPLEFMRPAFRKHVLHDEVLLYAAA